MRFATETNLPPPPPPPPPPGGGGFTRAFQCPLASAENDGSYADKGVPTLASIPPTSAPVRIAMMMAAGCKCIPRPASRGDQLPGTKRPTDKLMSTSCSPLSPRRLRWLHLEDLTGRHSARRRRRPITAHEVLHQAEGSGGRDSDDTALQQLRTHVTGECRFHLTEQIPRHAISSDLPSPGYTSAPHAPVRIGVIICHKSYNDGAIQRLVVGTFHIFRRHDIDQVLDEVVGELSVVVMRAALSLANNSRAKNRDKTRVHA